MFNSQLTTQNSQLKGQFPFQMQEEDNRGFGTGQAVVEYLLIFAALLVITIVSVSTFYPRVKETTQGVFIAAAERIVHADDSGPGFVGSGANSDWTCPFPPGHHSYCAVCEADDANGDGTAGCDVGEGQCSGSWHCRAGLFCDPETHKCVRPE